MIVNSITKIVSFFIFLFPLCNRMLSQIPNVSGDKFQMEINGSVLKIPVYSNDNLFSPTSTINNAIVVIHGTNRNADDYFNNIQSAADSVPALTQNLLIVAPQFLTETDIDFHSLDDEHLYWSNGGWKSGSKSQNSASNPRPERIPSYAVLDSLVLHLAEHYPNLESIVLTGHSAGGQVAQRLAASSPLVDSLCENYQIKIRFVVANPSSYLYMDNYRKLAGSLTEFEVPNTSCDFNDWKYGLENLYTYPGLTHPDSIRALFKRKHINYLLGENDNDPNASNLDVSCPANLQGSHRYERGQVFCNYLNFYYGTSISSNHSLTSVPNVGHNSFEMYNSSQGIYELFEKPFTHCETNSCPNEITGSFTPTPLYHQGSGSTVSNITFPSNNADVSFNIIDLGSKVNGNPNNRYIDKVTVTYLDETGSTHIEGVYYGNNQSSVSINITGFVQSVSIVLSDAYDGNTGSNTISVDMSDVTSCIQVSSNLVSNSNDTQSLASEKSTTTANFNEDRDNPINIYPNPFSDRITIQWPQSQIPIELIGVFDLRGREIKSIKDLQFGKTCTIIFDQLNSGVYFVQILDSNKQLQNFKVIKQ